MSADKRTPPPEDLMLAIVEALVFASPEPVRAVELADAIGGVDADEVRSTIERLQRHYEEQGSGLRVERVAGGVQLATRSEVGAWVRRFFRQRNRTRISPASLETLAIVAYRQPVTAPEIQAIRGKDPTGPLKTLLDKNLLRILGRKKVVGNPILYGTSKHFLVHFGLDRLDDLPPIEEFEEFVDGLDAFQISTDDDEVATEVEGVTTASEEGATADRE